MNRATDDLISRSQAIKEILAFYPEETKPGSLDEYGVAVLNGIIEVVLKRLPAVSRPKGKWIKMTGMMPPEYHGHYACSECGWHMKGLRNSWTREEELSYCPNCGAKMETKNE